MNSKNFRIFMSGPKCLCNNRIDDKIILITDPMSGLGYELANILASRGIYIKSN